MAFWSHPDDWGKGYATERAERLLAFGFVEIGAKKIWAGAGKWNKGSIRVLEKIGIKYTGDNPKGYYAKGEPIATREFEISRVRWQRRNRRDDLHA
jgi:RimJ/RimL family protein N-acetyltransferase